VLQAPVRALATIRPREHPGMLLGTAYDTAVLSVGPFLLPAVADDYDIGLGLASVSTAALLAGFVVGSFGAGRLLVARGRVLGIALIVALLANAACVPLPPYAVLVALRSLVGIAIGVMTWFAWSQVFGDQRRMSEIAVIGPLVALTTAPIAATLADAYGSAGIYTALAATAVVPLAFSRRSGQPGDRLRAPPSAGVGRPPVSPEARTVLGSLGLLTLGGSAVFTYGAVIAADTTTLSTQAVAAAFSLNAIAAVPSARWTGRRGRAGTWIIGCAAAAVVLGTVHVDAVFVAAIAFWGFAFWMGVPGAYALLAARSRHPEERAGDAQAVMAAGRVIGPLAGGVLLDASGPAALGILGGAVMALAGAGLLAAHRSAPAATGS
jgi:predicted MFS family arabinose efflux permease